MGENTIRKINGAIDAETARSLSAGDQVLYTGMVYTARDAAHARLVELLEAGEPLPFDIENAIITMRAQLQPSPASRLVRWVPRPRIAWIRTLLRCSMQGFAP